MLNCPLAVNDSQMLPLASQILKSVPPRLLEWVWGPHARSKRRDADFLPVPKFDTFDLSGRSASTPTLLSTAVQQFPLSLNRIDRRRQRMNSRKKQRSRRLAAGGFNRPQILTAHRGLRRNIQFYWAIGFFRWLAGSPKLA